LDPSCRGHIRFADGPKRQLGSKLPANGLGTNINRVCNANVPVAIGVGDKISGTFRAQLA
jgi:hypothetical protein